MGAESRRGRHVEVVMASSLVKLGADANEVVRAELQKQISLQNESLLNLAESIARGTLVQKNEEIAHLCIELQSSQEVLQSAIQERDEWMSLATRLYEMNQLLISLPPMNASNAHAHGSSTELESTGSCNQALNMEGRAVGKTHKHPSLVCKLCCVHDACMLILPCQHLCACKSCEIDLTVCPICHTAKDNAIEARFG
ncbi:hypothetical protein U9M48_012366 [Paspalum notatum var. saurae]|uniref:RING-type domain-containing protein n=1 Tax=Paspalum notatum var. saurae TaxID=547442 RepID=A0AAQ3WI08_PASNO